MTKLTISMPEPLKQFVDKQVHSQGYAGVSEYIQELVEKAISAERKTRIEEQLMVGLESVARGEVKELTKEDWQRLREDYVRQMVARQGTG